MSKLIATDKGHMHLKCNGHRRPLFTVAEAAAERDVRVWLDQHGLDYITGDSVYSDARLFEYRGSWYDVNQFEVASDQIKALGFDGMQAQSVFSAVIVRWFDADGNQFEGEIVVGYIHW